MTRMNKKTLVFKGIITIFISGLLLFAGCSGNSGAGNSGDAENGTEAGQCDGGILQPGALTDAPKDILQKLLEETELPETVLDPITAENAPGMLGMTPDDFVSFVEEAECATGTFEAQVLRVAVIKCKDAQDVVLVDEMIRGGFDSGQWMYVFPERSLTMVSGPYVMLAVGSAAETDILSEAFKEAMGGNTKNPVVFYTGETGGDGSDPEHIPNTDPGTDKAG